MRIEPLSAKSSPWYLKPFFWHQNRKYGKVLESGLLWARTPMVFLGVAVLYGTLNRKHSPINPVIRSLVTVRISQINACQFCVDLNSATLMRRGVAPEKVEKLQHWRDSNLFSDEERLALEYAEAMTYSDQEVDNRLMARLRDRFKDDVVVELTGLIAFQNLSSKFNSALAVPAQGFCQLPGAAPGAAGPTPPMKGETP